MIYQGNIFAEISKRKSDPKFMDLVAAVRKAERTIIQQRAHERGGVGWIQRVDRSSNVYPGSNSLVGVRNLALKSLQDYSLEHPLPK